MDMKAFNQGVIDEFRANAGKVGGMFHGAPMLLLTTTGSKTGKQSTTPLVYATEGDRMFVFGSKAGAPENPQWFNNLVANPTVTIEVGPDKYDAKATVLNGAERDRIFNDQAARAPMFAEYQAKTPRQIPVIELQRV